MITIKNKIIIITICILTVISFFIIYLLNNNGSEIVTIDDITTETIEEITTTTTKKIIEKYKVDIKGAVKNPGVYELPKDSIVNDVVNLAGGVLKNGTTKNINLSQKISDSMVIYIFTTSELTTTTATLNDVKCTTNVIEVNNCITTTKTTETHENNKKININTATKEELTSLTGIGESKADLIIQYRMETPFTKIEDIMNVSGIGESAFEKIKDNITV